MARAIALLCFVVAVFAVVSAHPQKSQSCGPNEVYTTCGSSCPLTCQNYQSPPVCTLACVMGCECKDGYVQDAQGRCVLTQAC